MKEIWTKFEAEYHGEFVHFDPMIARPKPVQKPHPPIHVGGTFPHGARRRSAMAMAGFQQLVAISPRSCRNSARWRGRPASAMPFDWGLSIGVVSGTKPMSRASARVSLG
jgi:alkanesulfonate monooxygenase SsuD/methylene tetrahydromethanopterin reductase-like flavin-dependent oxidoreductase (luciferase family)